MAKPPRIEVERNWSERHAHKSIKLAEDVQGRIWLRLEDLRQWMPGLSKSEVLIQRHPGMVRLADSSSSPYIEASTFAWLTQKSSDTATLKLVAWLEANVVGQARRRHMWEEYRGEQGLGIPGRLLLADEIPRHPGTGVAKAATAAGKAALDPRVWLITRGEWGIRSTLVAGGVLSLLGVIASIVLEQVAWDVSNDYVFWTWLAIAVGTWAIVWNAAWAIGAIRGPIRRIEDGLNPWLASVAMVVSLFCAMWMAFLTLQNSSLLLDTWWAIYGKRDTPVRVVVTRADDAGAPVRLRLSGRVGVGSYLVLKSALQENPGVQEIELSSPGGLALEGFGMTDLVASAGLRTIVADGCHSACSYMFLAGRERIVGATAEVGFHRSSSILGGMDDGLSEADLRMAEFMREKGVRADFIEQALATSGREIFVVTPDELVAAGVATAVVENP